jgi:DNA-binding CsgD family transcriptional regulator
VGGDALEDSGVLLLDERERKHVRAVLPRVSEREFEVLIELCGGGRNDQVAKRLCIALPTLRTHLSRLNEKLGTLSKSELVAHVAAQVLRGYRDGLLSSGVSASGP